MYEQMVALALPVFLMVLALIVWANGRAKSRESIAVCALLALAFVGFVYVMFGAGRMLTLMIMDVWIWSR